jgi:phospholipase/carboxylesterase
MNPLRQHTGPPLRYLELVPSGSEEKGLPIVIIIHGRGADAHDFVGTAPELDAGYRFIFPNAPDPFEPMPGYSFGFTWFDGWPPAPESIQRSRQLLIDFIDGISKQYETPLARTILCGFSQGGMMAADVAWRLEERLAGVVVMSGAIYERELPDLKSKPGMPILIVHGSGDDVIPVLAARRSRSLLEESGVEVEYEEYPMAHHVSPASMAKVREFMARNLRNSRSHNGLP